MDFTLESSFVLFVLLLVDYHALRCKARNDRKCAFVLESIPP